MTAADGRARMPRADLAVVQINVDGIATDVLRNEAESPLAWLARRKDKSGRALVALHHLAAGERLRGDFTRAQMTPRMTVDLQTAAGRRAGGGVAPNPAEFAEGIVAAKQRVARALDAVGPEFAGLLLDVCCFLKGLERVEQEHQWPSRSAKVVLSLGLERLARHYGLAGEARGRPRANGIRAWRAQPGAERPD